MRRRQMIRLYSLAAVLAAILPLAGLLTVSYYQTEERIQNELAFLADATAKRTTFIFENTRHNLQKLAEGIGTSCNDSAVAAMRDTVFKTMYIREVGLIGEGHLRCTNLGINDPARRIKDAGLNRIPDSGDIAIFPPTPTGQGGVSVIVNYRVNDTTYVNALIDPRTFYEFHDFIDIGENSGVFLLLADGRSIASFGKMDVRDLPKVDATDSPLQHYRGNILAIYKSSDFPVYAVVAVSESYLLRQWQHNAIVFATLGSIMSVLLVMLIRHLARQSMSLEAELRRAIASNELSVHYQPVIDLTTGRCLGAEALTRWKHPEQGEIPPNLFIPLAENSGLIVPMTEWLMRTIGNEIGDLMRANPSLYVSINLSPANFKNGLLELAAVRSFDNKLRHEQVIYEITERGLIDNDKYSASTLMEALRKRGSKLAIDDFGTGYSNLSYLQRFPVDYIKIDKGFVEAIDSGGQSAALVDHIIAIAASFNLPTIAEGVENECQAVYLKAHGVNAVQGWLFARPMPAADFIDFVRKTNGSRRDMADGVVADDDALVV